MSWRLLPQQNDRCNCEWRLNRDQFPTRPVRNSYQFQVRPEVAYTGRGASGLTCIGADASWIKCSSNSRAAPLNLGVRSPIDRVPACCLCGGASLLPSIGVTGLKRGVAFIAAAGWLARYSASVASSIASRTPVVSSAVVFRFGQRWHRLAWVPEI